MEANGRCRIRRASRKPENVSRCKEEDWLLLSLNVDKMHRILALLSSEIILGIITHPLDLHRNLRTRQEREIDSSQ